METIPVNLFGFCSTISTIAVTLDSDLCLLNFLGITEQELSQCFYATYSQEEFAQWFYLLQARGMEAANSDTSDDSKPFPPATHRLPSKGEKYSQIRSTSWILGPVATKR